MKKYLLLLILFISPFFALFADCQQTVTQVQYLDDITKTLVFF